MVETKDRHVTQYAHLEKRNRHLEEEVCELRGEERELMDAKEQLEEEVRVLQGRIAASNAERDKAKEELSQVSIISTMPPTALNTS